MTGPTAIPAVAADRAPAQVAPAATVLLLRETGTGALQVLMTKRAAGLSFMGGLWVFPGGRMEDADRSPAAIARASTVDHESVRARMLDVAGLPLSSDAALGLHVAACRETFEESGVLLARPRAAGTPWAFDTARRARLAARREAAATAASFVEMLEAEDLLLDLDRLVYWSHWITPSFEPRRFDTRFFAVSVPPDQDASVDRSELTHHAWLGEDDVRAHLGSGDMQMAPPTMATLEDLWGCHRRHGSVTAMLEAEGRRSVPPILPKFVRDEGGIEVVLPWDREYGSLPGEGCVVWQEYPQYLAALPSRRTLKRQA